MKKIMQFRYQTDSTTDFNSPSGLTWTQLASGTLFNNYGPVSHFGIQGPPGFKFYLNNGAYPIMIGTTGIYELDMGGVNRIVSFHVDSAKDNQSLIDADSRLMIDIVYDGGNN